MLTFLHPGFLWLLSLLAVPVVLHLLNMRQIRTVVFPSVRFLRMSRQPQSNHRQPRHLLLLFIRMLIIAAAVLLLASPVWENNDMMHSNTERSAMIVLDDTASMSADGRMERAMELCRSIAAELTGWKIGLIRLSTENIGGTDNGTVDFLPPSDERWRFDEALGGATATWLNMKPDAALRQAVKALHGEEKRLVIISDFQKANWGFRMGIVPDDVSLRLVDVKSKMTLNNCGISSVDCQKIGEKKLRVITTVSNGTGTVQERQLTVFIGKQSRQETLTIKPHGRNHAIMIIEQDENARQGRAQLSDDDYAMDNQYVFWADGSLPAEVLLVVDETSDVKVEEEAVFVKTALESEVDGTGKRFNVKLVPMEIFSEEELKGISAVFFLGGIRRLQNEMLKPLRTAIESGLAMLVTPGRMAAADLERLHALGIEIGQLQGINGLAGNGPNDGVSTVRPDSFLAPLYEDTAESDLYSFGIRRCCRILPNSTAVKHIESLSGLPLLLEVPCAKGRCFFSAFGFSSWWGDFQLTNSFLPLLHELLLDGTASAKGHKRATCGTSIIMDDALVFNTTEPGLYLENGSYVEVNVDPLESADSYCDEADMLNLLRMPQASTLKEEPKNTGQSLASAFSLLIASLVLLDSALSLIGTPRRMKNHD